MAKAEASLKYPHVTKADGVSGGTARIGRTRIRANNVAFLHEGGANDENTPEAYPNPTPGQIHTVAHHRDNSREIHDELADYKPWASCSGRRGRLERTEE